VLILVDSNMFTSPTPSNDANNATISEAEIRAYGLNRLLRRVSDDAAADAGAFRRPPPASIPSFSGDLSPTVASSANEQMVLGVGVSPEQGG
jgi:hypothetical protein